MFRFVRLYLLTYYLNKHFCLNLCINFQGNITYEWEEKMNWISCFACCDNGLSTMRCTLQEKNAYVSGEVLNMFVDVKNISKTNMQRLDVTLTRVSKQLIFNKTYLFLFSIKKRRYSFILLLPSQHSPDMTQSTGIKTFKAYKTFKIHQ